MTGNGSVYPETLLPPAHAGALHRLGPTLLPIARTEFSAPVRLRDIVNALGGDEERERCVRVGLEVLESAGQRPAHAVITTGPGRRASLDFYVEADCASCCELDGALQTGLAERITSVLPPGLSLGVHPLAEYAQQAGAETDHGTAERFRAGARDLLLRGGEMNRRLSVLCAYLCAMYEARAAAGCLGYLDQSLLEDGQEALSWRLRRHRSVEGRALAQRLERLSHAAESALYEFGTRFSFEHAAYQFELMRRFHEQLERFRETCRPDAGEWPNLARRPARANGKR
ncbi:hypothetical protein CupriaWKF_27380 [Cupriavidus sp. WKF15]|uniref:hypothetical protein n=1 Tax=Cupriavidus sp. WKF15 TaxID=3032282 RepID=UPI0023E23325|nr:hypothetical protein [Cupriavidus sp. WKF15]WER48505.1 hypothetical protein CupriaWKF_27380 [Cupriavidus sp. WKF15]